MIQAKQAHGEHPFDDDMLDATTRAFVQDKTMETHGLLKRTAEHIIQIGLNEAKPG